MKSCARCKTEKPPAAFYVRAGRCDSYCKLCRVQLQKIMRKDPVRRAKNSAQKASYYAANKARLSAATRDNAYRRKYGISYADFLAMVRGADGCCQICAAKLTVGAKKSDTTASLDHCHKTGKIRGVLCFACNASIGRMGDDVVRLRRAIAYLERE